MINKAKLESIVSAQIADTELFLVDITLSSSMDIEIIVDSINRVSIDQCAALSRAIDNELEGQGEDDFSLVVGSAGIGSPFRVDGQYVKCIGRDIEVVTLDGQKVVAKLIAFSGDSIDISYQQMVVVQGRKRKELVEQSRRINISEIKSVCEALTIK